MSDERRPFRLLVASAYFDRHLGGVELVAGRLAREFARHGHTVTWLATGAAPPDGNANSPRAVTVAGWNATERALGIPYPIPSPFALGAIDREARNADAVVIHESLYLTSIAAYLAARRHRKPVMIVQHIGAVPYRNPALRALMVMANRIIARPLLARADQIVFISATTAQYYATVSCRRPPELIFNGVDSEIFSPAPNAAAVTGERRRFGLPEDRPIALFVGRFVEKKGLSILACLARAHPDTVFAFAGWGPLDPRGWALPNVRVFERLSGASLAALYRASDVLVLPSTGEGFPLVIQEALACGLPVLCGAESAAADPAAGAFVTGLPVDPGDPAHTAATFGRALARLRAAPSADPTPDERARFARTRYAWDPLAARYLSILERMITATPGEPNRSRPAATHVLGTPGHKL